MKFRTKTYYFIINEIRKLKRAPLPIIVAFAMPIIAWICLALTFKNASIQDMPFVVVDYDNSPLSRTVARSLDATGYLNLIDIVPNSDIAIEQYRKMETYFIVTIPKDFQKKIKGGTGSQVNVQFNGANLMYAKIGYKAFAQTLSTISSGITIKRLQGKGLAPKDALAKTVPITTELHIIGNPYLNYAVYLLPGMLLSLLQMSASFSTLWVFRSHRESHAGRLVPRFGNLLPFMIGRMLPLVLATIAATAFVFLVIFPMSGIPITGTYFNMFLLTLLYAFVSMGMGTLVSIALPNLVTASQVLLMINAPSFVFSGYTYPGWAMPSALESLSNIIPVKHYLDGFFPMYLFDKTTELGIVPMLIIGSVLWGLTLVFVIMFNKIEKLKKSISIA